MKMNLRVRLKWNYMAGGRRDGQPYSVFSVPSYSLSSFRHQHSLHLHHWDYIKRCRAGLLSASVWEHLVSGRVYKPIVP